MAEEVTVINSEDNLTDDYCQTASDLQKCLKSIAEKILKKITDENFVQIYKNCYKEFEKKNDIDKPALSGSSAEGKKYHNQFNSIIMKTIDGTIDETVLNMNNVLKQLEELKKEQSDSSFFWRPPGNAYQHMVPFEYSCEIENKKQLENRIRMEQENLELLKSRILQKRTVAEEYHKILLASVADIRTLVTQESKCELTE